MPYEWNRFSYITGVKVIRVSTKTLNDLATYEGCIEYPAKVMLLSDCKTSLVLKLDRDGRILKRSFLTFEKDLDVCEYACNLKSTNLNYRVTDKKLKYKKELDEDLKMKDFVLKSIEKSGEDKTRYLYYLYFDNIVGYSKEKLLESIKKDERGKCEELYNFLKN